MLHLERRNDNCSVTQTVCYTDSVFCTSSACAMCACNITKLAKSLPEKVCSICISQNVQCSYTSSSPSSTFHCPHLESRHLPVPCAVQSVPQQQAVEDVVAHSSGSKQHGVTSPLAKVLPLTCRVSSSAAVNRESPLHHEMKSTKVQTLGAVRSQFL